MLQFDRVDMAPETDALREQVRAFIDDNREHFPRPNSDFSTGHDPEFSAKLGHQGWFQGCRT